MEYKETIKLYDAALSVATKAKTMLGCKSVQDLKLECETVLAAIKFLEDNN